MQITFNHSAEEDNGFTINGLFFRTFRCLGTATELLIFCKDAITKETESYYDGETKDEDFTGDNMHSAAGQIIVNIEAGEATFPARDFAKAAALAIASDTDAWTIPGYGSLNKEGVEEVHSCNRRRYAELGDLATEISSIT